jgi:hypothetical protein
LQRRAKTTAIDGNTGLIEAIRRIFAETGEAKLFTAELLDHLATSGSWPELTAGRLSALLATHGIVPGPVRRGELVRRGYHRRCFLEPLHANEDTANEDTVNEDAEMAGAPAATGGNGPAGPRSEAEDGQNDQAKAPPEASDSPPDPAAEAWRQRFVEQVAKVRLRNPARTEHEATIIAFQNLVEAWIRRPPPQADSTRCAQCGQPGNLIAIAPLDERAGATWLHGACFAGWRAPREAQAIVTLARYGITRSGLLPCAGEKPR